MQVIKGSTYMYIESDVVITIQWGELGLIPSLVIPKSKIVCMYV